MGFRFRKSIKIAPGVRLNVSKKGIGVSAGVKGARISTGPSGTRVTTSIPGTGISYEQRIGNKPNAEETYSQPMYTPQTVDVDAISIRESAATHNARKMMKPLMFVMVIGVIISLMLSQILFGIVFALIGFLCYKASRTPVGVICPTCSRQHLAFKQEQIQCTHCKSTLNIKREDS
ncbi:DUF4236 domain-containing protein [Bacillus sp. FSL R5-0677]|uniref:DUF4236 domain-containing protein n=1 Tax=Bacillus sp. FSL R5-0677 TaxID=2921581 RepID=UPI0030F9597D